MASAANMRTSAEVRGAAYMRTAADAHAAEVRGAPHMHAAHRGHAHGRRVVGEMRSRGEFVPYRCVHRWSVVGEMRPRNMPLSRVIGETPRGHERVPYRRVVSIMLTHDRGVLGYLRASRADVGALSL